MNPCQCGTRTHNLQLKTFNHHEIRQQFGIFTYHGVIISLCLCIVGLVGVDLGLSGTLVIAEICQFRILLEGQKDDNYPSVLQFIGCHLVD